MIIRSENLQKKEIAENRIDLESITEDIVTELDKKLKDAGYSSVNHKNAEENVNNLLSQLKILASGRKDIFNDFAKIQQPSNQDVKNFAQNAIKDRR